MNWPEMQNWEKNQRGEDAVFGRFGGYVLYPGEMFNKKLGSPDRGKGWEGPKIGSGLTFHKLAVEKKKKIGE